MRDHSTLSQMICSENSGDGEWNGGFLRRGDTLAPNGKSTISQ